MRATRQLIVDCKNVRVTYSNRTALAKLTCALPAAQRIAVLGPNGAGKSTFLKVILGLIPYQGKVRLHTPVGTLVYTAQRQEVDWNFPVTALDVALMGLYAAIGWLRPVRAQHRRAALLALERVGMGELAARSLAELSVGQQQRVFLARALAAERARFFLFDEPLAGVDMRTASIMHAIFRSLVERGQTVLCVHHELNTVVENFDHALLLNGRLVAAGEPRRVLSPANLASAYSVPLILDASRPIKDKRVV